MKILPLIILFSIIFLSKAQTRKEQIEIRQNKTRETKKWNTAIEALAQKKLNLEVEQKSIEVAVNKVSDTLRTVKIGKQEWMAENMAIKTFRNGELIAQSKTLDDWQKYNLLGEATWCYNGFIEGKDVLYNWYAVHDRKEIAPIGYRISTIADWESLANKINPKYKDLKKLIEDENEDNYVLSSQIAASVGLQLASVLDWFDSGEKEGTNYGGNDSIGFNALPTGYLSLEWGFTYAGAGTCFWTKEGGRVWLGHDGGFGLGISGEEYIKDMGEGYSIRCIKE